MLKTGFIDRQLHLILILNFSLIICFFCGSQASADPVSREDVPSEILVRFRHGADVSGEKEQNLGISNLKFVHSSKRFNIHVLRVQTSMDRESLIDLVHNLRKDPAVEWAEPNFRRYPNIIPNDPNYESQWHLQNTGQTGGTPGADIDAPGAWDITRGSNSVVVAVLDTGVEYTHSDLQDNMWKNMGEDWNGDGSPGNNGIDDDGNGYVDDYYGANMANDTGDPLDIHGHGTHVAGIIGAVGNNGIGTSGVAWNVKIMAVKFLDPNGSVEDEIEGISYILDQKNKGVPICAVNASFGGSEYSRFEEEALQSLQDAGIMVAAAAGNEGGELGQYRVNYPSSYSLDNIISVAATDKTDHLAYFSNWGFYYVDVAAPGTYILSTYLGDSYSTLSGTSMATPVVTGTVALLYSVRTRSILEARERIIRGVDYLADFSGAVFSNGRLNSAKALSVELSGPFIFGIKPFNGDPGSQVTINGVRFGSGLSDDDMVIIGGKEAEIEEWGDNRIVFRIPGDINRGEDVKLYIHTEEGDSNEVFFGLTSFKYYIPYAPSDGYMVSYLILCNYHEDSVQIQVYAAPSGAFTVNPKLETLQPYQVKYENIREYGLNGNKNFFWVESDKDIGVSLFTVDTQDFECAYVQGRKH